MRRPGYLSGYEGLVPRARRRRKQRPRRFNGLGGYGRLGAFGKGYAVGPPPPPNAPLAPSKTVKQDNALNRKTKGFYMQDARCPPGEKMWQRKEPCTGADCDPGEVDVYTECDDDPVYLELPDEDFPDCDSRAKAGWPDACNPKNCPTCFKPKAQQQQQSQSQGGDGGPAPVMMMMPGGPPPLPEGHPGMKRKFEDDDDEFDFPMPGAAAAVPAPSPEYQGGGAPAVPSRAISRSAPTAESKIAQMVEQHEERKLMTQYSTPGRTFIVRGGGHPGRARGHAPGPSRGPYGPEPEESGGGPPRKLGIMGWIREKLFG
jgi:hypothetical protein